MALFKFVVRCSFHLAVAFLSASAWWKAGGENGPTDENKAKERAQGTSQREVRKKKGVDREGERHEKAKR